MVDKKTGLYQGFSHGVTVNDIDNDGDLDVIFQVSSGKQKVVVKFTVT